MGAQVRSAARSWPLIETTVAFAAISLVLLAPAIYNRFPLIFPDTSVYLQVAFDRAWTLDRSGFYGLAFKPFVSLFPPLPALWLGLGFQIILISLCLLMFVKEVWPTARPIFAALPIVAVAAISTLPWHAAQLMPDAFTGPLVLTTWMAASRDVERSGTPLLWLCATAMALLHYTFLGLMPGVALVSFGVALWFGVSGRQVAKRLVALIVCIAVVVSAHVAVNGLKFDRWTVSPLGPMFLFARLNEDGLVGPWFDRHCGKDAPEELCKIRGSIPKDSQVLLWGGKASPFSTRINGKVGQPASWPWVDDLDKAAMGSINDRPDLFVRTSLVAGVRQFLHFAALDDECPSECQMRELGAAYPTLRGALDDSRQLRHELPRKTIGLMTTWTTALSLILLPVLLLIAVQRRDTKVVSLLIAVIASLVMNAILTGGLSDVHDRYQSRLAWIAVFVVVVAGLRWLEKNESVLRRAHQTT